MCRFAMRGHGNAKVDVGGSARITPQLPSKRGGDVTEPRLQSSEMRSASLEQQGMDIPLLIPFLEGRNAPRKREAWGLHSVETCSSWGSPVAVAALCGVRRPGALVLPVSP